MSHLKYFSCTWRAPAWVKQFYPDRFVILCRAQVGRTKSCPVATSWPQRLLAVRDLQDTLLAVPAPLALRSRGDFVWPPTSLLSHETTHEIIGVSEQTPVSLRESSTHLQDAGSSVEPLTPLISLAASSQSPSPAGASPHSNPYCHDRSSPCIEKDSVREFIHILL